MQQIFTFSGKFVDMVYGRGWLRKCWTEMGERHTMRRCVRRHVLIKHVILGDIAGRYAGIGSLEYLVRDYQESVLA